MLKKSSFLLPCTLLVACSPTVDKYQDIKQLELPPALAVEQSVNNNKGKESRENKLKFDNADLEKLIQITGDEQKPVLQMTARFDRTWDLVNNALRIAEIKVIEKDRDKGSILVHYIANQEEHSARETVFSFFTSSDEDTQYTIAIDKDKRLTDVHVDRVAKDVDPAGDDSANLVKLLRDTIITDLEK